MTQIFINRAELLPAGETVEQHSKWQREEAEIVQQDKANEDARTGGLFKGCFRAGAPGRGLRPIRDQEDGVDRCPLCNWELEDGQCQQCGLFFDEDGTLTFGDALSGFSDMDATSEHDMSSEDLDADMDMDDPDGYDHYGYGAFGGYDGSVADWQEHSFQLRRFLQNGGHAPFRRRMTHSEAGSRRSYSQSVVSEMYPDEMDTVEEEDEDELDEDSSMNDFIDDEGEAETTGPESASSTPERTPQPSSARPRFQSRARRVVEESETSSSTSNIPEDPEDEDEEDEGPIRRGTRNRAATRILQRANGSGTPSASSLDQDDDIQVALLREQGWERHEGDEEMEDDDSDGAQTTVGWDANANDRLRMGGSLTPTAGRPRPNPPIRPPSRVGNAPFLDGSRGLRRRSSVLSNATRHYEDGEADDDDSDLNDGEIERAMRTLRQRQSRAQMRGPNTFSNLNFRFANRGLTQDNSFNLETDDNSDTSQPRGNYNPRISGIFADHQRILQEFQNGAPLIDLDSRSNTPVARPRTANRNRASPAPQFSPFMLPGNSPARLRTPLMNNSSNADGLGRGPASPPSRATAMSGVPAPAGPEMIRRIDRTRSANAGANATANLIPSSPMRATSQSSVNVISQVQNAAVVDMIDRPPSRVAARPPSAAGRRNAANFSPVYPGYGHTPLGLNTGNRPFQLARGNPWSAFVQPNGIRHRSSRNVLREQSSVATLRAANSRTNLRDVGAAPPAMRSPASRLNLRHQQSQRRLNPQASNRTLRAGDQGRAPQSPVAVAGPPASPNNRPRYTQDEIARRGRELANNRATELGTTPLGAPPQRTNPFTARVRQNSINREGAAVSGVQPGTAVNNGPTHVRSNSNESLISVGSSSTMNAAPSSPNLHRRRSNRNIASAPPPGVLSPTQAMFPTAPTVYPNTYIRARSGSLTGSSVFDSPLNSNQRGLSPMVAAGDSARF